MKEDENPTRLSQVLHQVLGQLDFFQGQIEGVQAALCEALRTAPIDVQSRIEAALRERIRWMKEADPKEDPPGTIAGVETVLNGLVQVFHAEAPGKPH